MIHNAAGMIIFIIECFSAANKWATGVFMIRRFVFIIISLCFPMKHSIMIIYLLSDESDMKNKTKQLVRRPGFRGKWIFM